VLRILMERELGQEKASDEAFRTGPTPPAVLIKRVRRNPGGRVIGAAVVLLDKPASAAWMQSVASCFQKQSETAFLLPMAALEDRCPAQTLPQNPDRRRGPCAGSRRAVRCRSAPLPPSSRHLAVGPLESDWLGDRSAVFRTPQWRPFDGALPPRRNPEGEGPGRTDPVLVPPIWSCLHRPLEGLPLAPDSLWLFSGFPGRPAWRSVGLVALAGLKAPNLASLDGQALLAAGSGRELRAGACIDATAARVAKDGRCGDGEAKPDYQLRFLRAWPWANQRGIAVPAQPCLVAARGGVAQRQPARQCGRLAGVEPGGRTCSANGCLQGNDPVDRLGGD